MSQRKSSLAAELRTEWLRDINARLGAVQSAGSNGSGGGLEPHALSDTSIHTGTLSPGQAPWALTNSVAVIAGNGLTGGGTLTPDVTLNVGGGTLISIGADAVNLANGTAQYQVPVTGASPFTPAWTGLSDFAGNGLSFTAGAFVVGQGAGLTVDETTVALTLPGGLNATTTNSASGNHTHAIATGAASTLTVATTNTTGTGTNLARADHTHAIASSSNPGAVASILASDSDGYLTLVRLVATERLRSPLLDTASGPLTLQPANNVVNLPSAVAIQTNNYASQLTGWRATYAGEADFRYLFVDELHAKAFIADLEQALAGGQIITKSVAMVAEAFTVPAAGGAATLRVRDLPSAQNMAVFESGDIVRLRTFSREAGELLIADAWGVVSSYADGSGANEGTQTWTFTRSTAPNAGAMSAGTVIQPDSIVLDYGTAGNGFYEVNAIDGLRGLNSPYARVATWTGHPATGTALRSQFGNLRGVYGYADPVFGAAMGDATGANITVEATNGVRLRNGTTDKIVLATGGDSFFAGVMTIGESGEIRQGTGTLGSNFTGLRIWRDTNVGRIAGYNANTLEWYGGTDGYLYGGAGTAAINRYGYLIADVDISGGATWPFNYGGLHSVANVSSPTTNYRGSLMFGTPVGVFANAPRGWFFRYPGTLPADVPIGGGASRAFALSISDDNGLYAIWHEGNDGANSGLDADLLDGNHASAFALLSGATFSGNVVPNAASVRNLGSPGAPWLNVYVDNIVAGTITGTSLSGQIWQHDATDMYIRSNSGSARTLYVANQGAGLMHLDVEGNITLGGNVVVGGTVDGIDVSVLSSSFSSHTGATAVHGATGAVVGTTNTQTLTNKTLTTPTIADFTNAQHAHTGATSGGTISHTSLSNIGTNTHAQIDTHISTSDIHVAHSSVAITAGDGLTGGGTIAATRTLTLGTPSNLTATSTNAVTSTSHTHAIDSTIARSAIDIAAGNGLTGGGNLTANRTLTLGTPSDLTANTTNAVTSTSHTHAIATGAASTLTVASTNTTGSSSNLARADHTHAITSSSSITSATASILASDSNGYLRLVRLGLGMAPTRPLDVTGDAGISGQVIAGSGSISGALTVGGNFTVGSNILFVNQTGTRVGINREPDQQFDLDVAGAIRGQYLIGKHAIQLASAVCVWHFDGPAPYNLDFTGSNASHMGVGGTESGGVIYRPGRFGKAVQLAAATTNYVTNPSFELQSIAGWTALESPTITYSTDALYGQYALSMAVAASSNPYIYQTNAPVTLAQGQNWTFFAYVKAGNAASVGKEAQINLRETGGGTSTATITLTADWQRITVTRTLTMNPPTGLDRWIRLSSGVSGDSVLIDGIQLEQKAYATPYCDGSLGSGHSWSGTPHASTSSRTGATLTYANNAGLNGDEGTIMLWSYHEGIATDSMGLWGTGSNAQFDAYISSSGTVFFRQNTIGLSISAGIQPQNWYHYAFTWSKSANMRKIFINGIEVASRQFDTGATLGSTLYVGSIAAGSNYSTNGLIDEFVILDYAADPKLIRAIYESDAPVFVESSVFHWRSPSRVPIWVDEFGLWARGVSGNEILGLYGGDPRNPTGNVTRSWGGITMEENDIVIGRAAQAAVHWDDSAGTLLIGRPSASNLLLSGGAAQMRDSSTVWGSWSNSGVVIGRVANSTSRVEITSGGAINLVNRSAGGTDSTVISLAANGSASFTGAITASSGSITGALTIGASGGIYQGSGTFASPTTGLRIWNDSGIGRIGGYNNGTLQWGAGTDGRLYAGGGNVALDAGGVNLTYGGATGARIRIRDGSTTTFDLYGATESGQANTYLKFYPISDSPGGNLIIMAHNASGVENGRLLFADDGNANFYNSSPGSFIMNTRLVLARTLEITSEAYQIFGERSTTPSSPSSGNSAHVYMKADRLIIQFNDGGTVRYKYLDLTGTGVTWVHTTTAP